MNHPYPDKLLVCVFGVSRYNSHGDQLAFERNK